MKGTVVKAALLVVREGRLLLCRKRTGTSLLILPGGKIEPGETPEECVRREIEEELGIAEIEDLHPIGRYRDRHGEDPSRRIEIHLFSGRLVGVPQPQAEIASLIWFAPGEEEQDLAPSLRNQIMPDLCARGLIGGSACSHPRL